MKMKVHLLTLLFVCELLLVKINGQNLTSNETNSQIIFDPPNLLESKTETFHIVEWYTTLPGAHHASFHVEDTYVASVIEFNQTFDQSILEGNETGRGAFNVSATFIGFNSINITIYDKNNQTLGLATLDMTVLLSYAGINNIFTYSITLIVFVLYVNMGATIDLEVVKGIAKRPIGPLVGLLCQYCFMPVSAFALAKLFFYDDQLRQLGLFLNGASPGGGPSNMWTFLLGGSLDLSIMMTFVSTIVAFGAVPLWVFSLGPQIVGPDSKFSIPYDDIAYLVISLVIPCAIGLILQKLVPKAPAFIESKILPKLAVFNIIFISTFGLYSHRYIFNIFTWKVMLSCFALPSLGYLFGFIMALLTKRPWRDIIAISIETGVQNASIAIVILKITFGHPAGDLAVVMPACVVIMTPIPLVIAFIIKKSYECYSRSGGKDIKEVKDKEKESIEKGTIQSISTQPEIFGIKEDAVTDKKVDIEGGQKIEMGVAKKKNLGIDNPAVDLTNDVVY